MDVKRMPISWKEVGGLREDRTWISNTYANYIWYFT